MVKCPKCGNEEWSTVSCVTITDDYLKAMKEDLPSYNTIMNTQGGQKLLEKEITSWNFNARNVISYYLNFVIESIKTRIFLGLILDPLTVRIKCK